MQSACECNVLTGQSNSYFEVHKLRRLGCKGDRELSYDTNMASTIACISTPRGTGTLTDV
jgi:hypothetical protein